MELTGRSIRAPRRLGAALGVAVLASLMAPPADAEGVRTHPGAAVYKASGCMNCHKWHGMGGSGYGGTPINFRETFLDRDEIIEVIACGRPGTAMPMHHRNAYGRYDCYGGLTLEDLEGATPGRSAIRLSSRQMKNLAEFIVDHFKGRSNDIVESDCRIFFGDSRICKNLDAAAQSGGGAGH